MIHRAVTAMDPFNIFVEPSDTTLYTPLKTEEDLPRTNSQQCSAEPSAAQFSNRSSFESITPLCSNSSTRRVDNATFRSTVHYLSRHCIYTQTSSFSKLLFLEPELRRLLNALHLEVDVVGRWKIAASYYQKTPPINPRSAYVERGPLPFIINNTESITNAMILDFLPTLSPAMEE